MLSTVLINTSSSRFRKICENKLRQLPPFPSSSSQWEDEKESAKTHHIKKLFLRKFHKILSSRLSAEVNMKRVMQKNERTNQPFCN